MKSLNFPFWTGTVAGSVVLLSGITLLAADPAVTSSEQSAVSGSTASATVAPKLPYGVEDILKLTRAQISEAVVLNYVQNSGTVYSLSPNDIVYLRNEGVSDRVLNAMLEQKKKVTESVQTQSPAVQSAPAESAATAAPPAQYAATPAAPAPVYVQSPPSEPAPSTVYVIPYPAASYAYYGTYAPYYYGGYYGPYCGPGISLGFRFGGFGYRHGFYGHRWRH